MDDWRDVIRPLDEPLPETGEALPVESLFSRVEPTVGQYPQCGCSLEDMAETSKSPYARAWREGRYSLANEKNFMRERDASQWRGKDPGFCTRRGLIDVMGVPMCSLHAGQIALRICLGEFPTE